MANLDKLRSFITPQVLRDVHHLRAPFPKGQPLSGTQFGAYQVDEQAIYDLTFHPVLVPLSKLPLDALLKVDFLQLLPPPEAEDFPEQAYGLLSTLDQAPRMIISGYGIRYTKCFFDPISEKLAEQLISLPDHLRPDSKQAWMSRGYSFEEWAIRTNWFWAPLIHSDGFMVKHRQAVKDWAHGLRAEIESQYGVKDPFASLEAQDDVDLLAFAHIAMEGPPKKSYDDPEAEATIADITFWWIRIANSHFAITDHCGHYPYWVRIKGLEWSDTDREFMEETQKYYSFEKADEATLNKIRQDYLVGIWSPLPPNAAFEKS